MFAFGLERQRSLTTFPQIPLDPVHYPVWGATVYLPPNITFQYKFIRKETDGRVRSSPSPYVKAVITYTLGGQIIWESAPNREDTTPLSGVQSIVTTWR
jgi:hypothetical protein